MESIMGWPWQTGGPGDAPDPHEEHLTATHGGSQQRDAAVRAIHVGPEPGDLPGEAVDDDGGRRGAGAPPGARAGLALGAGLAVVALQAGRADELAGVERLFRKADAERA